MRASSRGRSHCPFSCAWAPWFASLLATPDCPHFPDHNRTYCSGSSLLLNRQNQRKTYFSYNQPPSRIYTTCLGPVGIWVCDILPALFTSPPIGCSGLSLSPACSFSLFQLGSRLWLRHSLMPLTRVCLSGLTLDFSSKTWPQLFSHWCGIYQLDPGGLPLAFVCQPVPLTGLPMVLPQRSKCRKFRTLSAASDNNITQINLHKEEFPDAHK